MTPQQFKQAHDRYLEPLEPKMEKCGECDGNGVLTDEQGNEDRCHVCNGEGEVEVTSVEQDPEPQEYDPTDPRVQEKEWGGLDV